MVIHRRYLRRSPQCNNVVDLEFNTDTENSGNVERISVSVVTNDEVNNDVIIDNVG